MKDTSSAKLGSAQGRSAFGLLQKQAQLSYERLKEAQFSSVQSRLSSVLLDKAKSVFIGVVENVSVSN